jgi:hypothetical protein
MTTESDLLDIVRRYFAAIEAGEPEGNLWNSGMGRSCARETTTASTRSER